MVSHTAFQTTDTLLLVKPRGFRSNEQTASDNFFQKRDNSPKAVAENAEAEFNLFVQVLANAGVNVIVADYSPTVDTPDRIFPNNWISFHEDGSVVLYPMYAGNRRGERRIEILEQVTNHGFIIHERHDLTRLEVDNVFLEGTGSLVLDRISRLAYAAVSERTSDKAVHAFCRKMKYTPVLFHASHLVSGVYRPIYHTNVLLTIGKKIAILSSSCIRDTAEKKIVTDHLSRSHILVHISEDQMNAFAGNMLEVRSRSGSALMVMSTSAYESLEPAQLKQIGDHCRIIHSPLSTIEKYGGGSARCMMAEIFLPKKESVA